jgi:methyltransferase (TIGR00027 family)
MSPRAGPSLTARSIAAVRRRLERPTQASGDPAAEDRMVRSLRWAPTQLPGFATYIAERTRFFDETLLAALQRGVRQVVIVGAGYDGRALRYRQAGVIYFEVDHPATQGDKRRRLEHVLADPAGIAFVPVDFGRDSIAHALADAGHSADAPTHFLCEGVTPYLPMTDLCELVRALTERAAPGSTFAVDTVEPGQGKPLSRRLMLRLMRTGTAIMGERFITLLEVDDTRELLVGAGWCDVTLRHPTASPYPVAFALTSK